jgi:hypothetical protein
MIGSTNPKSASHKNLGPKIAIATFAEDLLIYETSQVRKFADLRFAELIFGPPCTFNVHCKKGLAVFPSQAGMSLIKLFLGGNNLVFPAQREFDQ